LVLPVLAAFATSLMVARAGLLIADFPEFSENTLAGKSTMASGSCRGVRSVALTPALSLGDY
ncbi:hypothetical protein, partial [Enterobacter bugandensis]|uniref:hypothetical protein n=1 Tax=Enterobacter bugandensis TaxID=881260 RepID=UPI001C71338E